MAETTTYNIELIVEEGGGLADANSYVSATYADTYAKNRNYDTWLSQSEYVKKASIIKAMDYVDNLFNWKGKKKFRNQALSFPRIGIIDNDDFDRSGEIPENLKKAICEAAFYVVNQYTLFGKTDPDGPVKVNKERKKADVAEIETEVERKFFSKNEVTIDWTSAFQSLDTLLKGLFNDKSSLGTVNTRVRWD